MAISVLHELVSPRATVLGVLGEVAMRMTLVERLRNPAYVTNPSGGPALLDISRTLATMSEAADRLDKADRSGGRHAKARELRATGLTIRAIAAKLGYRTTSAVHAALKK